MSSTVIQVLREVEAAVVKRNMYSRSIRITDSDYRAPPPPSVLGCLYAPLYNYNIRKQLQLPAIVNAIVSRVAILLIFPDSGFWS